MGVIYKITNTVTKKAYIGQTTTTHSDIARKGWIKRRRGMQEAA